MSGKRKVRFSKSESARKAITKQQLKEINKLYQNVYKEMDQKQKDLANKTTYSSGIQRLYLDQFKKDMQAELSRVNAQVKNILEDGSIKVAEAVVQENNELLKSMGLFVNGAFSYVPTNAVRAIINGSVYNGQWTLSKALWGSNQKNIKSIENIVAGGLAGNKSIKEISKDLMSYSKSGSAKYNATRLARTMSNHAYQKAYQMTTEKNPFVEAYQWNNGTSNTCPLCIDLATQDRFGLGNGVFPKNEVPLDHPNGFCYITSIMSSRDDVDQALLDWINGTGDVGMNQQLDEFAKDMGFMPQVVKNAVEQSAIGEQMPFDKQEWLNKLNDNDLESMTHLMYDLIDNKLTKDEINAIFAYTGEDYSQINSILREGIAGSSYQKVIDDIHNALTKASMPEDIVVLRTSKFDSFQALFGIDSPSQWRLAESGVEKYNGTVINDKGFMSTTINSEAVADGNVNYYIKLPEGSNAMPIWGLSEYRDEREVLIDKDSKFIVENVESEHISGYQYNFNVYMTLLK
jgi:hypothetical protein